MNADDLALALSLADAADAMTLPHFVAGDYSVRTKSDRTPVSEVDEAVERMLRERLERERPDDGIVGEEEGVRVAGKRRWILDPIDATKNYIRGVPAYATLIALQDAGRVIAGVVSAPALGRRWWASAGAGAFCNGLAIHVSSVASFAKAYLSYDGINDFDKAGLSEQFIDLARRFGRTRAFGDFWSHMLVAEGAIDVAIEPEVALWDLAALQVIVEEAGGRFTNLAGEARPDGGSAVSTNGILHDEVLATLRPTHRDSSTATAAARSPLPPGEGGAKRG
ncbi:MAG TPA: inositol monophosphatase family protein [Thermoanaerobaculia bacterium]|nr:inositol monophosphatase family protein [Thermoanaerobaculia bacterium]